MNVLFITLYSVGLIAGLVGLWWSSDKAVEYSLELSDLFKITTFFIGFVLIAISTGLPELAITIASLWNKVPSIAAGTIIGSNLGDISLVLGLPAIVLGTLNVRTKDKLHLMFMLMVSALVMAMIFITGVLTPLYGAILILLYVVSIWWLWKTKAVKVLPHEEVVEVLSDDDVGRRKKALWRKIMLVVKVLISFAVILLTSKLSIDCAIALSKYLPVRLDALGATIFAVGTSLPELAVSFQAVKKKEYSLAFGNAFGSVLEQATLILGVLALGARAPISVVSFRPIAPLMFLSYAIVAHSLLKKTKIGRQEGLGRIEGVLLVALFVVHISYFLLWAK